MHLLKKYIELKKKIEKSPLPVADISHHKNGKPDTPLPVADISHHKNKKLDENVHSWINKTQPEECKVDSRFSFRSKFNGSLRTHEIDDPHNELSKEHIKNLTPEEQNAAHVYINGGLYSGDESGSRRVNNHLIESHKNNKTPDTHFTFTDDDGYGHHLNLHHLDSAIERNKLPTSMKTYSGITFDPRKLLDSRNKLHMPAYTSSSTNRGVAAIYSTPQGDDGDHHIIQIHHPKGSTGLYIGDDEDTSGFQQKEHISPRGMTLHINPTPEVHEDSNGAKLHVWSAKRLREEE